MDSRLVVFGRAPEWPTQMETPSMPCILVSGAERGLGLKFARQYRSAGWVRTDICGSPADPSPQVGVAGMRQLFERVRPAQCGRFFDHSGQEVP